MTSGRARGRRSDRRPPRADRIRPHPIRPPVRL